MNIGITGWWKNGNEGDFRILECMTRALAPHSIVPIDLPFSLNEDSLHRMNLLDFIVLGGGGLFQDAPPPHPFQDFEVWGKRLQTPIGVAGVGIDAILPEYRASVHALAEQARFFFVRDRVSEQIAGHPKVQVAPDLTFLYPIDSGEAQQTFSRNSIVCGVNLRNFAGFAPEQWIETLQALPFHLRGIPMATYDSWQEIELLQRLDPTFAGVFDSCLYQGLGMMIGTAFHSVVFAIQAAIPVIGIAYAPKVHRLMADIGLERFSLEPNQWQKLPRLLDTLLDQHRELSVYLRETTHRLTESAWQCIASMRKKIKEEAKPQVSSGAKVSIIVVGNASNEANHATLESCLAQTHKEVEIIFASEQAGTALDMLPSDPRLTVVQCDPNASTGNRLNRAVAETSGDYVSWLTAGDCYARDAVSCMVDRLSHEPGCDMVFTDYYSMQEPARIADIHSVDTASRLLRRDVVGPCFMYRRRLGETVGPFKSDSVLVAYDYWLRASKVCHLQPMHARLFYASVSNQIGKDSQTERNVRQEWRSTRPWLIRVLWHIVDNDLVEHWVIQPVLAIRRNVKSLFQHHRTMTA